MINKKQQLYNKAKQFQRETDWTLFRKFCKAIQKKIQSEYWKYLARIIDPERTSQRKEIFLAIHKITQ